MDLTASPVSIIILIVTILFSLYGFKSAEIMNKYMLHPWSFVHERHWYQIITSGFLHGDWSHLIFNMLTFYFFALQLESIAGTAKFAIIYFGSMALANVSSIIKNKNNEDYRSLGASGAIAGVLFSFILFEPGAKISMMFFPIGIPAPIFGIIYLAYCVWASKKANDYINHEAHFWGALAGVILTIIQSPQIVSYFIEEVF